MVNREMLLKRSCFWLRMRRRGSPAPCCLSMAVSRLVARLNSSLPKIVIPDEYYQVSSKFVLRKRGNTDARVRAGYHYGCECQLTRDKIRRRLHSGYRVSECPPLTVRIPSAP